LGIVPVVRFNTDVFGEKFLAAEKAILATHGKQYS
jgi:hypothetical protein